MSDYISRDQVLNLLWKHGDFGLYNAVAALPCFPDPNPNWKNTKRNVMGQTEEEFWDKVDK